MDYRIRLILSRLHLPWAGMRLRDLHSWIGTWQLPEMYAGPRGGGAELAWWHLSATRDDAFHAEQDILGAAIDIYKCVYQIVPLLGQVLMHLAGVPWSLLRPYSQMMRDVKVVNVLPQGAGAPYKRRCSIPQIRPWSMMVFALTTRPCILYMRRMSITPRNLADDLMLINTGDKQLGRRRGRHAGNLQHCCRCHA